MVNLSFGNLILPEIVVVLARSADYKRAWDGVAMELENRFATNCHPELARNLLFNGEITWRASVILSEAKDLPSFG
jgi:hypothetical protein